VDHPMHLADYESIQCTGLIGLLRKGT